MNHDHGISIYKCLQTDEDSRARRASGNNTSAAMERSDRLALILLLVSLLPVCRPVDAWYKQAARPSYYSVGRASGLLSGMRRSEPELEPIGPLTDISALPETHFPRNFLKNMPICVKDVFPDLQSCEFLHDSSLFKCGGSVIFSLDSRICLSS